MSLLVATAAATGSAISYAMAGVLQHRAAQLAPVGRGLRLKLLAHLASRPGWLVGLGADAAALSLHALALSAGELSVVQPLLVSGLLFALPASVVIERGRPSMAEWCWALVVVAGLAVFLIASNPSAGHAPSDTDRLAVLTLVGAGLAGAVVLVGWAWRTQQAALLGVAGGLGYGMTAALLKETINIATGANPIRLVSSWPLYLLVAVGAGALLVTQVAYQSGPLAASLPALTMVNPIVAIALGILVFDEHLVRTAAALSAETVSFVIMSIAVGQLARRSSTRHSRSEELAASP